MPSGEDMDSREDMSGNDTEMLQNAGEERVEPTEMAPEETQASEGNGNKGDTLLVQKRLKQQKRAHEREMHEMQARMAQMQSQLQSQTQPPQFDNNPYTGQPPSIDDAIHKAVSFALQHKENEERKAKEMMAQQHVAKEYQALQKHLDATADKYDDFDDIVRGDSVPFTASMRDAALMLPKKGPGSAGEVLYKLGKDPEALSRIASLHPLSQAAELVALSHAMIQGADQQSNAPRPLGQIKANPVVNSAGFTDKTPVSSIRAAMKSGKFK